MSEPPSTSYPAIFPDVPWAAQEDSYHKQIPQQQYQKQQTVKAFVTEQED